MSRSRSGTRSTTRRPSRTRSSKSRSRSRSRSGSRSTKMCSRDCRPLKRCPNGYHVSKNGTCVYHGDDSDSYDNYYDDYYDDDDLDYYYNYLARQSIRDVLRASMIQGSHTASTQTGESTPTDRSSAQSSRESTAQTETSRESTAQTELSKQDGGGFKEYMARIRNRSSGQRGGAYRKSVTSSNLRNGRRRFFMSPKQGHGQKGGGCGVRTSSSPYRPRY